ncbi:fatty acid desaturase [Nevskia sp.]|uniref:fatty acid desaturase n=1 Tax=Nevskia sp. TaxID=1929292 RepID=UPI0025F511BA|nr:fatty acid desaturase [Nevskia sp.]
MASIANPAHATANWQDGKRYWWLMSPALPVLVLAGLAAVPFASGVLLTTLLCWVGFVLLYAIAPVLDWMIGTDPVNAPELAVAALEQDAWYRNIVFAYVPAQYAVTALGAWVVMTQDLAWFQMLGVLLSTGVINGVGINTAHELGHKTNGLERWLAKLTLAPVAYGHFFIEHNKGHHKHVATPLDPASSAMGETLYQFLPRSFAGSLKSAWKIEADRLTRLGKPVWSLDNDNLQAWSMTVVLFAALTLWLGWPALIFLVVQAVYGASLLEVVNYLEHYGLARQKLADGRYERCQPRHSWNSNHVVTNLLLYQLQRHSDHHANPTRRFQALRHFEDSPQLPSGYASMILAAYFPRVFFKLMDHRVAAHHGYDLSKARIETSKREALMRRWHRPERATASASSTAEAAVGDAAAVAVAIEGPAYVCPNCRYVYAETRGCPTEGWLAGTTWAQLPTDWTCPQCAVREKPDFARIA